MFHGFVLFKIIQIHAKNRNLKKIRKKDKNIREKFPNLLGEKKIRHIGKIVAEKLKYCRDCYFSLFSKREKNSTDK